MSMQAHLLPVKQELMWPTFAGMTFQITEKKQRDLRLWHSKYYKKCLLFARGMKGQDIEFYTEQGGM